MGSIFSVLGGKTQAEECDGIVNHFYHQWRVPTNKTGRGDEEEEESRDREEEGGEEERRRVKRLRGRETLRTDCGDVVDMILWLRVLLFSWHCMDVFFSSLIHEHGLWKCLWNDMVNVGQMLGIWYGECRTDVGDMIYGDCCYWLAASYGRVFVEDTHTHVCAHCIWKDIKTTKLYWNSLCLFFQTHWIWPAQNVMGKENCQTKVMKLQVANISI